VARDLPVGGRRIDAGSRERLRIRARHDPRENVGRATDLRARARGGQEQEKRKCDEEKRA
jgi:hypothetical protein